MDRLFPIRKLIQNPRQLPQAVFGCQRHPRRQRHQKREINLLRVSPLAKALWRELPAKQAENMLYIILMIILVVDPILSLLALAFPLNRRERSQLQRIRQTFSQQEVH